MDLVQCLQGNFLVVPTFVARCLYVCKDARDPSCKRWNRLSKSLIGNLAEITVFSPFMQMFLSTNLRQVTDGDVEVIS